MSKVIDVKPEDTIRVSGKLYKVKHGVFAYLSSLDVALDFTEQMHTIEGEYRCYVSIHKASNTIVCHAGSLTRDEMTVLCQLCGVRQSAVAQEYWSISLESVISATNYISIIAFIKMLKDVIWLGEHDE